PIRYVIYHLPSTAKQTLSGRRGVGFRRARSSLFVGAGKLQMPIYALGQVELSPRDLSLARGSINYYLCAALENKNIHWILPSLAFCLADIYGGALCWARTNPIRARSTKRTWKWTLTTPPLTIWGWTGAWIMRTMRIFARSKAKKIAFARTSRRITPIC